MTTELRVHLLGEFRLYRDGVLTPAAAWHTRQARQVFKVLLAEYGRVVPAQRLQDLLWTETAEHPEKTLRSAVNALRAVLEPDRAPQQPSAFVPRGQRGYRLLVPSGRQLWVDVVAFEQELDQALAGATSDALETSCARLHAALARYTGDYLVEDGEATWVWPERERLRERYFVGVTQLVAWHRDAGQWAAALACAQQGLARDPLREALYAVSMQCQAQMGETAQALQTFERCRSVLARALGTNPSPMLLRLHAEILRGEQPTMGASAPQPILPQPLLLQPRLPPTAPFIGRAAELAVVRQRLAVILPAPAAPITSRPFALAVGGAPGVGKTRFVDQVHQMVQGTPVRCLTTRCFEVEQVLPYAPILSLLGQRRQTTGEDTPDRPDRPDAPATIAPRLSATLASVETTPDAISASATLARLFELMVTLCERQALVLVVEDAHWADEATTLMLNRLLQQRTLPLLLLLTYCPEELEAAAPAARLLRAWRCADQFQELHLEPFTPDDIRAYLFAGQFPTEYAVDELAQGTGGNALLLGEALRLPRTNATTPNATAPTSEQVAPAPPLTERLAAAPAVRARLLARLARLSPLARRWAARAAILRRAFAPSWFGAPVSAQDDDALERLIAQGFLVEVCDPWPADACLALAHPIIGQVVISACSQLRLTRLRLEVAEALASLSAPLVEALAAEIAAHYHAAGLAASGLALRYDVLADDVARRQSHFRDAALATTARPANHPVTSALGGFRLALMLCIMGHIDEGAQLVARLLTQMQALNDAAAAHTSDERLLASLVTNLLHRSDQALRVAPVAPLARAGAMAPTQLATPVAHMQQVGEAHETRTLWAPFVPPMPFPALDLRTLITMTDVDNTALLFSALGWTTMLQGSNDRAWAYIKAAMQTAKEARLTSSVLAEISLIRMLFARGHAKEAFAWYHALESRVRAAPEMAWALIWPQIDLSYRRIAASQLDEAERLLTRLQRDLPQQQDFVSHQHAIKIAHGLLALQRDQRERAQTLLSEAMAAPEQIYIEAYAQGEIALAHITADNGDASAAMERLQALLRFCGERGLLDLYCLIALEVVPLCDALGQPQDAQYLAQEVYRLASGAGLGAHRRTAARLLAPHAQRLNG